MAGITAASYQRQGLGESIRMANGAWSLTTARSAGVSSDGKRQLAQFRSKPRDPIEEYDFYARLG